MRRRSRIQTLILVAVMCGLLMAVTPALAQDSAGSSPAEATAITDETPTGIGTLMLLLGLGAIVIVGGVMIARDNFTGTNDEEG